MQQPKKRKRLQELTIKDNFLFGAVMSDEENARQFLERALGFPIEKVTVSTEKSMVYHPEYKGIRLDVVARDADHTHYNIEMQVAKKPDLGRRSRYYHSQIDMELLLSGTEYDDLPNAFVIFICDFDPFGLGKYRYTFRNICREDLEKDLDDGSYTIFLSTHGRNREEVPGPLVEFLHYVGSDLIESEGNFEDEFVVRLQETVRNVKASREMEERFMLLEEMMKEERKTGRLEGRKEAVLNLLEGCCEEVPSDLQDRIMSEESSENLKVYLKAAARATSLEDFLSLIGPEKGIDNEAAGK